MPSPKTHPLVTNAARYKNVYPLRDPTTILRTTLRTTLSWLYAHAVLPLCCVHQARGTDWYSGHKRYKGMSNEHNPAIEPSHIQVYQIRIKGHLEADWTDWFDGLAITLHDNGETLLTGPVVDQAALHGLLRKVRDLGMVLLSVIRVSDSKQGGETDHGSDNEG